MNCLLLYEVFIFWHLIRINMNFYHTIGTIKHEEHDVTKAVSNILDWFTNDKAGCWNVVYVNKSSFTIDCSCRYFLLYFPFFCLTIKPAINMYNYVIFGFWFWILLLLSSLGFAFSAINLGYITLKIKFKERSWTGTRK